MTGRRTLDRNTSCESDVKCQISKTVTDTTMGPIKVEYETTPDLSIGTITFDLL